MCPPTLLMWHPQTSRVFRQPVPEGTHSVPQAFPLGTFFFCLFFFGISSRVFIIITSNRL